MFPKAALGTSPLTCSPLIDIGSSHLSSGSLFTRSIETPPDFPEHTTIAANHALDNTQFSCVPFVAAHEINTAGPNAPPPILYTGTTPLFPPPDPPLPPTNGFPPLLDIVPDSVSPIRQRQPPSRPVVCTKHFTPRPEDAKFHSCMARARAHPNFREPAVLKKEFCSRKMPTCAAHRSSKSCFIIRVGPSRGQCRTESVALRKIHKVLGLCWTCNTWLAIFSYRIGLFLTHCSGKCLRDKNSFRKHKCEPTDQHPFTTFLTQGIISTMPQQLE